MSCPDKPTLGKRLNHVPLLPRDRQRQGGPATLSLLVTCCRGCTCIKLCLRTALGAKETRHACVMSWAPHDLTQASVSITSTPSEVGEKGQGYPLVTDDETKVQVKYVA